jgi:uncharacterized protein YbaR (Trm112 family)
MKRPECTRRTQRCQEQKSPFVPLTPVSQSPWADGTRQLLFEPLTLLEKLAALIPRPRINLVLYHGVLAPHADWRARVVTYGAPPTIASACSEASDTSKSAPRHWAWAALMRRAFGLDVLACPRCGGRLRLIATVENPEGIRAILAALAGSRERQGRAPPGADGEPPSPAGVLGA